MDEPLSNLDAKLRLSMRAQLAALHANLGATTVYVTHDQVEAMTLGRRVAVMRDGTIQQVESPTALYARPVDLFVAAFIGSPAMNLAEGDRRRRCALRGLPHPARARAQADRRLRSARARHPPRGLRGRGVRRPVAAAGRGHAAGDRRARLRRPRDLPRRRRAGRARRRQAPPTRTTRCSIAGQAFFNARLDAHSAARVGALLRLAVDPSELHFFDADTGENLSGVAARPPRLAMSPQLCYFAAMSDRVGVRGASAGSLPILAACPPGSVSSSRSGTDRSQFSPRGSTRRIRSSG